MPDLQTAAQFYGELLGWEFTDVPDGRDRYLLAMSQGLPVTGLQQPHEGDYDVLWSVYLETRDVTQTVDAAVDLGATVLVPPVDVVEFGRLAEYLPPDPLAIPGYFGFPGIGVTKLAMMAVLADPSGCNVGLWHWRGGRIDDHRGAPGHLVGAEHLSLDPQVPPDFYCSVPGWEDAVQHGVAFHRAPDALANLAPLWVPSFGAADVGAAAQRAIDLGGGHHPQAELPADSALITGPWGEPFVLVAAVPG